MQIGLLKPAQDWKGQSLEERLTCCAEALFVHDLIEPRQRAQILDKLRQRAELARRARIAAELATA